MRTRSWAFWQAIHALVILRDYVWTANKRVAENSLWSKFCQSELIFRSIFLRLLLLQEWSFYPFLLVKENLPRKSQRTVLSSDLLRGNNSCRNMSPHNPGNEIWGIYKLWAPVGVVWTWTVYRLRPDAEFLNCTFMYLFFLCFSFFFLGRGASLHFFLFSLEFLTKPWKYEYSLCENKWESLFEKQFFYHFYEFFQRCFSLLGLENGLGHREWPL